MPVQPKHLTKENLRSPRAATIAGLVFSLFLGAIIVLIHTLFPSDLVDLSEESRTEYLNIVSIAVGLVPIAGVAFLWFMGVARDLLGHLEDQFYSTLSTGSGLLFLAMLFVWASVTGALVYGYSLNPTLMIDGGFFMIGRKFMLDIINVFGMSMAGVYVFSSGSIWFRTGVVPRWLAILTWATAVLLWLSVFLNWWVQLVFPLWVFIVSFYLLVLNKRNEVED